MDQKKGAFPIFFNQSDRDSINSIHELDSLSDILKEACSPSLKPFNKISIPTKSYDPKILESVSKEPKAFILTSSIRQPEKPKPNIKPPSTEKPEKIWGEINEELKYTKPPIIVNKWEFKDLNYIKDEKFSRSSVSNFSEIKPQESKKIQIPDNPYKSNNPDEALKLENKIETFKRSKKSRAKYQNFRDAQENPENRIDSIPYSLTKQVNNIEQEKSETWNLLDNEPQTVSFEEFNLKTFRTQKCQVGEKCKGCTKYHYEGEKRRSVENFQYFATLCQNAWNCKAQERCGKAHNFTELFYHPQVFRSVQCPYALKYKKCIFGNLCNFIHLFGSKNNESRVRVKCKSCNKDDVNMVRVKCGHACCKNCAESSQCKRCAIISEAINLEIN